MTEETFWEIINSSCKSFNEPFKNHDSKYVVEELSKLTKDDIISFEYHFRKKLITSDTYNIKGLYEIMDGPNASDDSYLYFKYSLIMQSKIIFDKAMYDTDKLSNLINKDTDINGEPFMYMADYAFISKFGEPVDENELPTQQVSNKISIKYETIFQFELGEKWEYADLPLRFPNLWAKFNR